MAWPTTYQQWLDLLRDWIDVDDVTAVPDSVLGTCFDMATTEINRDLDTLYAESPAVNYTILGTEVWPVSISTLLGGATDFNKMILVNIQGLTSMRVLAINEMIDMIALNGQTGSNLPPGISGFYSVQANQLSIYPIPTVGSILQIRYSKLIPSISASVNSTVYSLNHPDIFLYGALVAAEPYVSEDERVDMWKNAYDNKIEKANLITKKARMGSTPLQREISVYGPPVKRNPLGILYSN